jgi:hypothetical protein
MEKVFFRLTAFNFALNGSFTSQNLGNIKSGKNFVNGVAGPFGSTRNVLRNNISDLSSQNGEIDFNIPWSIGYNYALDLSKSYSNGKDTSLVTQTLGINLNFNVTPKWKVGINTGYDFRNKDFNSTTLNVFRDLHCWQMAFNWVPLGPRQSFSIEINVKSQMLRQLRLAKRRSWVDFE